MQRLAFARRLAAIKSSSSSPIPISKKVISNSNLLLLQSSFSSLSNDPRFFSQISITDPTPTVFNDAPPSQENEFENVVVSLLLRTDDGSLDSSLNSLQHLTTTLNQKFVLKLIETPNVSADHLIRFIKWARTKKSFKVTTPLLESLVSAICAGPKFHFHLREKEIDSLWDLVKDVGLNESVVLNVWVLHELILSFSVLRKGKAALEVFNKFEVFQCVPNKDTYYFTIQALCRESNELDNGWSVCQKMLDQDSLSDDADKISCIVSWFCLSSMAKQAHAVYLAAKEKRKQLPSCTFNLMVIRLCEENETVQLALEMLLNDIPEEGRKQVIQPFSDVVETLCRIKEVDAAKQLIFKMIADGPPPGIADFGYVITGYTKAGEMGQAMEMVKLMESRGFKPDLNTLRVVIHMV